MSIILDDLGSRGVSTRKVAGTNGGEYHGQCPRCGGDDRFHVWPEQGEAGTWWCRGCNKGGDAIEYLMEYCGQDFKTAAASVGRDLTDIPRTPVTPKQRKKPVFQPVEHGSPAEMWREKALKLVDWAHEQLLTLPEQMAYLASRGIGETSVRRFRLGYNPGENGKNAIFRARKAWGLPEEMKNGRPRALWIPRGIVIPLIINGAVHRIRIRREKADMSENFNLPYYVLPGSSAATLVVGEEPRAFVVVEAELDAMACTDAAGDLCSAAAMGSSTTKPDADTVQRMGDALCILNALDFDVAGARAWHWWRDQFAKAKRWPVPAGKDPGDAVEQGVNLRAWMLAGLPPIFHRTGSSALDGEEEKTETAKNGDTVVEEGVPANIPDSLRQVADWFSMYPVRIVKNARRIKYQENRRWVSENKEISRRINLAIFMDPAVYSYIVDHPARVITGQNFLDGLS